MDRAFYLARTLAVIDQKLKEADDTARKPMSEVTRLKIRRTQAMLRRLRFDVERIIGKQKAG